jgi:hypothetical protein
MITTRLCCHLAPIPIDKAAKIPGERNGWILCLDLTDPPLGNTCDPLRNTLNSYSEGISSVLPFVVIRIINQYFILEPHSPPSPPPPPLRPYTQTLSLILRSLRIQKQFDEHLQHTLPSEISSVCKALRLSPPDCSISIEGRANILPVMTLKQARAC